MKLGLVVHACNLPTECDRIRASFEALGPETADVSLALITEADYAGDLEKFNPAAAKNVGIRRLIAEGCDGVVCIDADYLLPPGLFTLLREPAVQPYHVWITRRDIPPHDARTPDWRRWAALPIFADCRGSCNYMSTANWLRVGGWDERTYGWGGDDDVLHIRVGQAGITRRRIDLFPLVHVGHGPRPWSGVNARGVENIQFAHQAQPNYIAGIEGETP